MTVDHLDAYKCMWPTTTQGYVIHLWHKPTKLVELMLDTQVEKRFSDWLFS